VPLRGQQGGCLRQPGQPLYLFWFAPYTHILTTAPSTATLITVKGLKLTNLPNLPEPGLISALIAAAITQEAILYGYVTGYVAASTVFELQNSIFLWVQFNPCKLFALILKIQLNPSPKNLNYR